MDAENPITPEITILHLEDDPRDAEYYAEILRQSGMKVRIILANTREGYLSSLDDYSIDLILCDNSLPDFDGKEALVRSKALRPELPFVLLTGSIGEEAAVEILQSGATDYILKHKPHRLVPAIHRALREKAELAERKRAEIALRVSEERYSLAMTGANDGLWDWDLRAGILFFSPRWKSMLGHQENEIGSDPEEWFGRIHPDEQEKVKLHIDTHLKGSIPHLECEYRIRTNLGNYIWVLCRGTAVRDSEGKPYRIAGSQGDISSRKRAEEQLQYEAFHDSLTGQFNRNLFLNRLQKLMWIANRKDSPGFFVLLLGLDRFAGINDGFGRHIADQALREASSRIAEQIRPGDTLARLGGDEFGFLRETPESDDEIIRFAQAIQQKFHEPVRIDGREVFLTVSVGIFQGAVDTKSPEDILRSAGIALGQAKARGKSGIAVFDAVMYEQAVALLNLEAELRHAIQRDELRVHYQPIVFLADEKIAGFEALVRWQHPIRGLVPPMEFIPMAEESHLINDIGRIVLEKACKQMSEWLKSHSGLGSVTVSVNVSGKQFRQADIVGQIEGALAGAGMDATNLKLEITETAIMDDPRAAAERLLELQEAGIQLQVDDFGTGYSSLAYLHKFPLHALKIDRSFVCLIGPHGENSEICATIINLAHNLGMKVIAEGIETPDQLHFLKKMGCDFGQGFLFSRPLEPVAAEKWMERNSLRSPGA